VSASVSPILHEAKDPAEILDRLKTSSNFNVPSPSRARSTHAVEILKTIGIGFGSKTAARVGDSCKMVF
jgi:hypothetical protein